MEQMTRLGLSLLGSLALLAQVGCCFPYGSDKPPWPPALDATMYQGKLVTQARRQSDATYYVTIAGARLAKDGIYLDLLITTGDGPDPTHFASGVGLRLTHADHPDSLVRLETLSGESVTLKTSTRQGNLCFPFALSGPYVGSPPNYLAQSSDDCRGVIQVCMLRTPSQLEPGEFYMRLLPPNPNQDEWVWRPVGGVELDTQWTAVRIDWPLQSDSTAARQPGESSDSRPVPQGKRYNTIAPM